MFLVTGLTGKVEPAAGVVVPPVSQSGKAGPVVFGTVVGTVTDLGTVGLTVGVFVTTVSQSGSGIGGVLLGVAMFI